ICGAEVREVERRPPRSAGPSSVFRGISVAVVYLAFLWVRQNLKGLGDLFEAILRSLIAGIDIRMVAPRHLAISLLYILGFRSARNPQQFIIIRTLHTRFMLHA